MVENPGGEVVAKGGGEMGGGPVSGIAFDGAGEIGGAGRARFAFAGRESGLLGGKDGGDLKFT